jgi:hypothetical protein
MSNKAETKSSKCIVHSDFLEDITIETDVSQNFVNNLDIKEQESDSKTNNLTDNLDIISSQDVSNIKISDESNNKNDDENEDKNDDENEDENDDENEDENDDENEDENDDENEDENDDENEDENDDENDEEYEDGIHTLNPTIDNDTLFALRTYYQDYYEDETDIIQLLKTNLIDEHYSESQANTSLREFYNSFGINIDLTIFEEVQSLPSDQELFNEFFNSPNNGVLVSQLTNIINNMPNNIFNNVLMPTEDVLCTLDEEEKEKLNKFKLETKIDQKCNICLEEMIEGDEVVDLPCDHTYHSNCIFKYLEEYNYKCPTCRKEVGKPKYNI